MTKSEKLSLVFLKISFTMRHRLIPEMACSTLTRICDNLRLLSFSLAVSSFLCGFFSVERVGGLWAHSLETPCLYGVQYGWGMRYSPSRPLSCRAFCLDRFD